MRIDAELKQRAYERIRTNAKTHARLLQRLKADLQRRNPKINIEVGVSLEETARTIKGEDFIEGARPTGYYGGVAFGLYAQEWGISTDRKHNVAYMVYTCDDLKGREEEVLDRLREQARLITHDMHLITANMRGGQLYFDLGTISQGELEKMARKAA